MFVLGNRVFKKTQYAFLTGIVISTGTTLDGVEFAVMQDPVSKFLWISEQGLLEAEPVRFVCREPQPQRLMPSTWSK